jgi:D-3-phosphoglycerate dehydrogenase
MTWRVLISAPHMLPVLEQFRPRLEGEGIEMVTLPVTERLGESELLAVVPSLDGVICGDDQFTERVLLSARRLKVISKWGTGIDSIDRHVAARLGIQVFNTPDAFTDPVADSVMGYVLAFARRLPWMNRDVRAGLWQKVDAFALRERTLGIVGVGNIGRAVARRASAFGMKLCGNDPVIPPATFLSETCMRMVDLRTLLAEADFISLNCDLNPTSFHLIGRDELALARRTAVLINTARGPIVDEDALGVALQEGRIAGAALDVFEVEPLPADSPLRALDQCLLGPHNSNSDPAARMRVHEATIANLLRGLRDSTVSIRAAVGGGVTHAQRD